MHRMSRIEAIQAVGSSTRKTFSVLFFVCLLSNANLAKCDDARQDSVHRTTVDTSKLEKHVLLVTHAYSAYDRDRVIRKGLDEKVAQFKSQSLPVVYLMNTSSYMPDSSWYTEDRQPDF